MTNTEICLFDAEFAGNTSPREFAISIGILGHANESLRAEAVVDIRQSLYESIERFNNGDRGECGCGQCSKRTGIRMAREFNELTAEWIMLTKGEGYQSSHLLRYDGTHKQLVFEERNKKSNVGVHDKPEKESK